MIDNRTQYIRFSNEPTVTKDSGFCSACGGFSSYDFAPIVSDELAKDWGLSKIEQRLFSARESMFCMFCGCSYRLRALAEATRLVFDKEDTYQSLEEAIAGGVFNDTKIAEINSCGVLHEILKKAPKVRYSEYMPNNKKVRHEDLMGLSYSSSEFDLVLTSDTLEHVPDYIQALKETYRVLKDGGYHILTVPVLQSRETKTRVLPDIDNKRRLIEKESFHGAGQDDYLVWTEFGRDFASKAEGIGFIVQQFFINVDNSNDPSQVFVMKKSTKSPIHNIFADIAYSSLGNKGLAVGETSGYAKYEKKYLFVNDFQAMKLKDLAHKIKLTNDHVNNLEAIISKPELKIAALEAELRAIYGSRRWKLTDPIVKLLVTLRRPNKNS